MIIKKINEYYGGTPNIKETEIEKFDIDISNELVKKEHNIQDDINDVTFVCKVYWKYELEEHKGSIETIIPIINKITLDINIEIYNAEDDSYSDDLEYHYEYTPSNSDIEFSTMNQALPFSPTSIEIENTLKTDGESKPKITLEF